MSTGTDGNDSVTAARTEVDDALDVLGAIELIDREDPWRRLVQTGSARTDVPGKLRP